MTKNINFDALNTAALPYLPELLKRWLPDGELSGQEYKAKNPRRDDAHIGSFSINVGKGAWNDFATDDAKGYGVISLAAYIFGLSVKEAAKNIAAMLQGKDCGHPMFAPLAATAASNVATEAKAWLPIVPVPADAPVRKPRHYKHGNPSDSWEYRDAQGELLFVVCRFDGADGEKEILPLTFCSHVDGKQGWRWQALPEPRPLYGLQDLAERPDADVLVVEGEKAADAAAQMFPDFVVITSPNGSRAASKADWSPTSGRVVRIWPDNDDPGSKYAAEVARMVLAAGAKSASVVNVPSEFPDKWDLADEPPEGWDTDKLRGLLQTQCTALVPSEVLPPRRSFCSLSSSPEPTQAEILIRFAKDAFLFRTEEDDACIDVTTDKGQRRTWFVDSSYTRRWLTHQFYKATDSAPTPEAMTKAISTLVAKALFDGEVLPVFVRVGNCNGTTYIDLCDEEGNAIAINRDGWSIVRDAPIRFMRKKGMLPLQIPARGGSVSALRKFMNVDDEGFILAVSWLLMAMRERGPYPILVVTGEQGTAKSTMLALLRKLIDPNSAPLRSLPKDLRDLFIAAKNSWVLAFDNLSYIRAETSDIFCQISTGGGYATRTLYANDEETLFSVKRPMLFNGIENVAVRGDLADRAIILSLLPISDAKRKSEEDFWTDVDKHLPAILGGLLDAVVVGMKNLPDVQRKDLPRMADFARWGIACETAFGAQGCFIEAYNANRLDAVEDILAGSPFALAIISLLDNLPEFKGSATVLLQMLNDKMHDTSVLGNKKLWPGNAKNLSQMLRRIAPALRKVGVAVDYPQKRVLWLRRTNQAKPAPSAPSAPKAEISENKAKQPRTATNKGAQQTQPKKRKY
jgi:hypothetical protein